MRLATTIGDFRRLTKTPAEAVRAFEGTGFRCLDYDFYSVIYPGSPFLGDDWIKEVDEAAEEAARLGLQFVQAHSPNYNPLNPAADHEIHAAEMIGRAGYTPYEGFAVRGGIQQVWLRGTLAVDHGAVLTGPDGKFIPRGKNML